MHARNLEEIMHARNYIGGSNLHQNVAGNLAQCMALLVVAQSLGTQLKNIQTAAIAGHQPLHTTQAVTHADTRMLGDSE